MSACPECNKEFASVKAVAGHMRVHNASGGKSEAYTRANLRMWSDPEYKKKMAPHLKKWIASSEAVRQTPEYRKACRDAQIIRYSDPEERAKASKLFSGSGNPRWNPDRSNQTARDEFIFAIRSSMKKAKHGIFSGLLDHVWPELGYTSRQLKEHIEKQFAKGMDWSNWGEWHIDHIVPVSRWDLATQPVVVNALSNLRPLWKYDNLSKAGKLDEERIRT